MASGETQELLETLELREYESKALEELLTLGRTTAPNLAEATGIPRARIYDILSSLSNTGYVEEIPGRPKQYQPKSPEEILDRSIENRRQEFKDFESEIEEIRPEFLKTFEQLYQKASEDITPTEDLFHVVDVGDASETETRRLYREAEKEIKILTKAFEYFDSIEPAFEEAYEKGIPIRILMLEPSHLSKNNQKTHAAIHDSILAEYPDLDIRFSNEKLPLRGTMVDPSMDYESGKAILLVEEKDIPLSMRQAAITENGSFVAGLNRYFDLIWEYDSRISE